MNPIQMYINTIELMADWAVLPWDSYMRGRQRRSGPQFSTEIAISPWPAGLTSQLQIKHAVTGLYRAGIAIAKGNKFYRLAVELIEQSLIIGEIIFQPRRITNNSINLAEGIYPIGTFSAQSGSRDDARDPKFKILYKFDGIRISSSEAFTSVLDGLATSAMHDKDDRGAFINAYSSSYTSTINIHGVGVQSDQLSWYHITRALVLIWYVFVSGPITRRVPSYEGMEFTLEYDGKKIGEGHLWNFSGVGNDMGGRAISK